MAISVTPHVLSVILPTRNRALLLAQALESLTRQTLAADRFEVVIVDDGSTDDTPDVCRAFASRLPLRCLRLKAAGIAAAKNLAVTTARGSIVLFFDDDDLADAQLCASHVAAHQERPAFNLAVLGHTDWAPGLEVTPVMDYAINVGHFLFAYTPLEHQQMLDFSYFWGGRSSCKRVLLVRHGLFNQMFTFGCEDIELGYRLKRHGLQVVYDTRARQFMNRAVTFDELCRRCERQGMSQWHFSRLHPDRAIQEYCEVIDAAGRWPAMLERLPSSIARVHELESIIGDVSRGRRPASRELYDLYGDVFRAFKTKGIVQALTGTAITVPVTIAVKPAARAVVARRRAAVYAAAGR